MKTKRLLLVLTCLLLLAVTAQSQMSPTVQQTREAVQQTMYRSFFLDDRSAYRIVFVVLEDPELSAAWNMSDEQIQELRQILRDSRHCLTEHPEYQELLEAIKVPTGHPDVDEETLDRYLNAQKRMVFLQERFLVDSVEKTLTPDQIQKLLEAQLAAMDEKPIISASMFEALNLTDTQRQQMEAVKIELEHEIVEYVDSVVRWHIAMINAVDAMRRSGVQLGQNEQVRMKLLLAEDPVFKRIYGEARSSAKAFSTLFRTKMFDVLTTEQWSRLQELIGNPPKHAQIFIKHLRKQMGEGED